MGQREVLEFLEEKRKKSNRWVEFREIKEGLRGMGLSVNGINNNTFNHLYSLCKHGFVEQRQTGFWDSKKFFRAKKV